MLKTETIAVDGNPVMASSNAANQVQSLFNRIIDLIGQRQFGQAEQLCRHLNQQHPSFAPGWYAASVLAVQQGMADKALLWINQALSIKDEVVWQLHKVRVLGMLNQRQQARTLAEALSNQAHNDARICAELALQLNNLGLHQQALDFYQRGLDISPDDPGLLFNLASLQRYMGQLTEAEDTLNRLIEIKPEDGEAWLLRAGLRRQTAQHNHIEPLKIALQQPGQTPINQAQFYYALGKELEDLHHYPECFEALQQGARIRRRNMQYSVSNDIATLQKITEVFDSRLFAQPPAGHDSHQPIFILGLPRTGSTMVERIISSHSDVFSAGELNNFALQMMAQVRRTHSTPPPNKLALIELTRQLDFARLGQDYIQSTQPDTQSCPRFIDKLPLNSLYVGLIHLALPNAKIIHVQRHPMDSCFAIFKQLFTNGYPFSYDLQELAQYQIAHHQLMQHWHQVLPGVIHTVHYEQLVTDLPAQAKQLIHACQLPWQTQCSQFEKNAAPSTTASTAQVRQPVYQSSVGKWRHFEQQLSSVKHVFEQAGILCD